MNLRMENLAHVLTQLVQAIINLWRGQAVLSRPSLFTEAREQRRSILLMRVVASLATVVLLVPIAGLVWMFLHLFPDHVPDVYQPPPRVSASARRQARSGASTNSVAVSGSLPTATNFTQAIGDAPFVQSRY